MLFGDYNPAGRLPITFPQTVGEVPLFYDYKPSSRKPYIEISSNPLFPFGFGLSYTTFACEKPLLSPSPLHGTSHWLYVTFNYFFFFYFHADSSLKITPSTIKPDGTVTISVDVTNTGKVAGEEVAQLYIKYVLLKKKYVVDI